MKKNLTMALCVAVGLLASTFGSDSSEMKDRIVELSKIDWADVQRGMNASNQYYFAAHKVMLVITNNVEELPLIVVSPYRPAGRGAERLDDRRRRSLLLEPQDYVK